MLRLIFGVLWCGLTGSLALSAVQAQVQLEDAFPALRFEKPVDLQHAGDASGRLFVVEQRGTIKVFANDAATASAETFLDIQERVESGGERGLLGLAFHPEFEQNGFFYVNYTTPNPLRTRISRFQVDPESPGGAAPGSEQVLLEVVQPYSNHNAGQLAFGPDGYLYVGLGDGGAGGDPQENGQDRSTLLGSLLRIDVDTTTGSLPYGIPADNPFAGNTAGYREEIYAWGLRNPWRFSFDAETGQLWLADVGQNLYEEIDVVEKGKNYGWNTMEGVHCFDPASGCDQTDLVLPVWEYSHRIGQSVTGGYVYRGTRVPALVGQYIYADYASGRVWALTAGEAAENQELLDTDLRISSFGVDAARELYLCAHDGKIYRLAAANALPGEEEVPGGLGLMERNYPNPFSGTTFIPYTLDRPTRVELTVHDELGRRVRTLVPGVDQAAGRYEAQWDGLGDAGELLAAGIYFCRMKLGDELAAVRRMVLVR